MKGSKEERRAERKEIQETRKGKRSEDLLWASPEEMDEDWSAPDDIGVWERDREKKV